MTSFTLQAVPSGHSSWATLARRVEEFGYAALTTADHPGSATSPFVALAAAAAVTSRIRLGSYVSNAGVREPILLASDVATLDLLSNGRAVLGIGAGHTPAEWLAVGRERPPVAERVRRCIAVAAAVRRLLDSDEEVTVDTSELSLVAARLTKPRPVQRKVPLLFGGGNSTLLEWAGRHADLVGLSGLGRTLEDGHRHTVRWSLSDIDRQVDLVRAGAADRDTPPELEALVQVAVVTDDPAAALAEVSEHCGLTADQLRATPFVLVGTEDEIAASIADHQKRWGITRYAVREPALEEFAPLVARLRD